MKYHYLREEVQRGVVNFWYYPTNDMKADGLTKPLPRVKHIKFVRQLNLKAITPPKEDAGRNGEVEED